MQFCASCGEQTTAQPCTECGADPRLDGRYVLRSLLGQGSHGMTWKAEGEDGATCAIKVINLGHGLQSDARQSMDREVAVLRQLDHPQIPALLDDFSTRSGMTRYRCIVQDFVDGPHLLDELATTRHTPRQVMATIAEVAEILAHLHGLTPPIIHRDIKPQNLIRRASDGRLVLIDFGSVRDTLVGTLGGTMSVGTVGYMAPEQITGDVQPASDLYALGALAVHLLTRQPPRLTHDASDPIRWRRPDGLPEAIGELVDALLRPDPSERPDSAEGVARTARRVSEAPDLPAPPPPQPEVEPEPSVVSEPPATLPKRSMVPLLVLYPLLGSIAMVAPIMAAVKVDSITITGAIGSVLGLVTAFLAARRRQRLGMVAALSAPAISLLFFLVIVFFSITESDAADPVPILLGLYAIGLIGALSVAMGLAIKVQHQRRWRAVGGQRRRKTRQLPKYMPDLMPIIGSRREREKIKATARDWRSGIIPEVRHVCPFCGTAVRPNNLVRHYDKVHLPDASRRRRWNNRLL
ncbi:MAG: hypothetical protein ACI8RZ_000302 [Myxococcota bacterium]|jgi:hypothetical protein